MLRVLIVDDNEDLLEVLTVLLSLEAKFDIVAASGVEEALKHLTDRSDIDGIICDFLMQDGTGKDVYQFNKRNKNLPFALFTALFYEDCEGLEDLFELNSLNRYIRKSVDDPQLFDFILDIERKKTVEGGVDMAASFGYHKLPLSFLKKFKFKSIDYFVQLRDDHFVKVTNAGDDTSQVIEKYELKNVHFFYIKVGDLSKVFNEIFNIISDIKKKSQSFQEEIVELSNIQFEISLAALKHLGLKREHLEFVNKSLTQSLDKLTNVNELKGIFDRLNQNDGIFKNHALLTLYLATPMIYSLGWNSPSTMEKIIHAALLHDSALAQTNFVEFENEIPAGVLTDKELAELKQHPFQAVENLKKFDFIHMETLKIIQEHHERPDGKGYPVGLAGMRISALGAAFIIAHDFALFLLKNSYDMNLFNFYLNQRKNLYSVGPFKKCFDAFSSLINKAV
ncbi:MAG: hypothetical protein Fur0010_18860 [Bdellovibrio sp.]